MVNYSTYAQAKTSDSLLLVFKRTSNDSVKLEILNKLINNIANPIASSGYNEQIKEIVTPLLKKRPNNSYANKYYALYLVNLGTLADQQGDFVNAIQYVESALKIQQQIQEKNDYAISLYSLGILYYKIGKTEQALDYLYKGLNYFEKTSNYLYIPPSIQMIGIIQTNNKNYKEAKELFTKSLSISQKLNDKKGIADAYNALGSVNSLQKQTKEAINYHLKALTIMQEINNVGGLLECCSALGYTYGTINEIDSAKKYYSKAYNLSLLWDDQLYKNKALLQFAWVCYKNKELVKALSLAKKAHEMIIVSKSIHNTLSSSKLLYSIYNDMGDYKNALRMHELYMKTNDSIVNDQNKQVLYKQKYQYDFDRKSIELKLALAQKEQILKFNTQQLIDKKNRSLYVTTGAALFIITSLVIIYLLLKRKQLKTNNDKLLIEQRLLRAQINPHFIFNALTSIQEYIANNKSTQASDYLVDFSELMRLVLENSSEDYISVKKDIETLTHFLTLQKLLLRDTFDYHIEIDTEIDTENTFVPPMLVQPFIENAIKHGISGRVDGFINIQLTLKNDYLLYKISDNGIGIDKSFAQKKGEISFRTIHAVDITKERLRLLNIKNKALINFKITEAYPQNMEYPGTCVSFTISPYLI